MGGASRSRRLLKVLGIAVLAVALLAAFAVVAVELALRSESVRELVLARVTPMIEERLGVSLEVADFSISLLAGSLTIDDLVLRKGVARGPISEGSPAPFARVERIRAVWLPTSPLSGHLRLHELEIVNPSIDLGAPLPEVPRSAESETPSELPVTIDRAHLTGGSVVGPVPRKLADLVDSWRVSELSVGASVEGNSFAVEPVTAIVDLALTDLDEATFDLAAEVSGRVEGPIDVGMVRLSGDALTVDGSGGIGTGENDIQIDFSAETDPGFWLGQPSSARVAAEGEIDLSSWQGALRFSAPDLPGTLLTGLLEESLADQLELASTTFDAEVDLRLVGEGGIDGDMRLTGSRGSSRIFEVVGSPLVPAGLMAGEALPFTIGLTADLLPTDPGTRLIEATLSGDDAWQPDEWQITDGTLDIQAPRVDGLLQTLSSIWPQLLPTSSLAGLPSLGRLTARGGFSGPLMDPRIDAGLDWIPHEGGAARATLSGRPIGGALELRTEAADLDLTHFAESAGGRLEWSGGASGTLSDPRGAIQLVVRDLASRDETGGSEKVLEVLDVRASGSWERIEWALDATSADLGQVEGHGSMVPAAKLAEANGVVSLTPLHETGVGLPASTFFPGSFDLIEAGFEFTDGVVELDATGFTAGREALSIDSLLPLDAIARIPGAEALATFPVERSDGLLDISWQAPVDDWASVIPESMRDRVGRLEAGSSGRLELDTSCPACSRAYGQLVNLAAEVDGRLIEAVGNPDLALADGTLRLGPWSLSGEDLSLTVDAFAELDRAWELGPEVRGLIADAGLTVDGDIGSSWLEAPLFEPSAADGAISGATLLEVVTPGTAKLRVNGGLSSDGLTGQLTLDAEELKLALVAVPHLPVSALQAEITISGGEVNVSRLRCRVGEGELIADGRLSWDDPFDAGSGSIRLVEAVPGLKSVELPFKIDDGLLSVDNGRLENSGGEGSIRLAVPLTSEAASETGRRIARFDWQAPRADWGPLLRLLTGTQDPDELTFASQGAIAVDLSRPVESSANITVGQALISVRGRATTLGEPMVLTLERGQLTVPPSTLISGEESFTFEGRGELDGQWRAGDPIAEIVSRFEIDGEGSLDSGLMTPFLSGGRALGPLAVDLEVAGTPSDFSGRALIEGSDASILYRSPYLARISEPRVELSMSGGGVRIDEGTARLNNGPLIFGGTLLDDGHSDVGISFEKALFRLDYGLLATVSGDLRIEADLDGTGLVSGDLTVDRGSLTRDVRLDFDLLTGLLAPIDLSTTADDPLALIALDMSVATREGVRVKNNLGDLMVRWEPIAVTGSLARPILKGDVEVDPGGLLYAYGQTVRLDRAVIEYPGGETDEPRLDLEVTTSLEDPTIANLEGDDPFRSQSDVAESEDAPVVDLRGDLAFYYGEQVASRLGESVGAKISLRPLLIFGEADPGARLTVSQDFSSHFAVAASIDLTNVENRTYLLEAHEFRGFPGFVGQTFTDDEAAYGGALLQRLEFGGSQLSSEADLPRLGKIKLEKVPGISKRGLKRALGLTKGEPFAPENEFAAEVEVLDFLQAKGYPNAAAELSSTPTGRREQKVRLALAVEPGPHVDFEFIGEKLAKPLRKVIRSHYRIDFFEPESIEAMREETIRALRSKGFVSPDVRVKVEPRDPHDPDGDRLVVIETVGGARISPEAPIFEGVEPEEREVLAAAFFSSVQRVELAEGLPGADARLLRVMRDLGYPAAEIRNRYTSLDDRRLTVEIEAGPRRTASSVDLVSDKKVDIALLESLLAIGTGEPLRKDRLGLSALRLQQALADDGFLDARVRTVVGEGEAQDSLTVPVRFDIEWGDEHRVEIVEFSGLRSTKESWVRRTAGIETGEQLKRGDLPAARTTLWKTGLFSAVETETEDFGDGRQRVLFDLAERDRFRLAYGIRWDSADGTSAVFDITDENFLGRQLTLGLRALWSDDDKSVRWLTRVPRAGGGRGSIEFFALARELVDSGIIEEILEGTLQYSRPIGERSTLRMYGRYTDTKLREEDPDPFFPLDERIKSPLLGWQYLFDSRGREIFPSRGLFFSVDLSGSEEFLGSDFRYARLFSQMNLYRGIGRFAGRPLSWAQSYRVGFAQAFDQELLRSERFFAGGEYSVRGYDTESLGPQETLGSIVRPLGGESLLVVNQELRWRVFTDYSLLLFGDFGNVWEDSGEFGSNLFSSVGLGVRAATPVGMIRLDLAQPLDLREGIDSEWVVYFGLGATF